MKYYVIGREEVYYTGTLKQCQKYIEDVKYIYPDHVDMKIAEEVD